jgi:hypothetical protein
MLVVEAEVVLPLDLLLELAVVVVEVQVALVRQMEPLEQLTLVVEVVALLAMQFQLLVVQVAQAS